MDKKIISPSTTMGGDTAPISQHLVILYDSILNSVFESQVLQPIAQRNEPTTIISFEPSAICPEKIASLVPPHISVIQYKKYPFMGVWSLAPAVRTLKTTLAHYKQYTLTARGPIAGYLALNAQTAQCSHITMQARGLLAEEYAFAHRAVQKYWKRLWHAVRTRLYRSVEAQVYAHTQPNLIIEAVSPALKEYLVATYGAQEKHITIAQRDIPAAIPVEQKLAWRAATRAKLGISEGVRVYCYNGSAKAWQCPQETVDFFAQRLRSNSNALLLVLSQDIDSFRVFLHQANIPEQSVRLVSVPHQEIFKYLAAADTGLLFREHHIINWVSRPTKALEYHAIGLPIVHNNTVAYLQENL